MRTLSAITPTGLAAAAFALLAALLAGLYSGGAMFSPGALHAGRGPATPLGGITAHAQLTGRCGACHGAPWRAPGMSARCLACHTDVQAELGDSGSLHATLPDARRCLSCHTEHQGSAGVLTRFGGEGFDHGRFGFSLAVHRRTAAGESFTCAECHDAGSFRFSEERCVSCHREVDPRFTAEHLEAWGDACQACHDGADRYTRFDHGTTEWPLTGAHAEAACAACHREARGTGDFRRAPRGCVACHRQDDPHRGGYGPDCGACHGTGTWEDVRFEHPFPLDHGAREASRCLVCHEDAPRTYRTYTCYGCHEHSPAEIRREHLEEGIRDYRDCAGCHPTGREEEGERRRER